MERLQPRKEMRRSDTIERIRTINEIERENLSTDVEKVNDDLLIPIKTEDNGVLNIKFEEAKTRFVYKINRLEFFAKHVKVEVGYQVVKGSFVYENIFNINSDITSIESNNNIHLQLSKIMDIIDIDIKNTLKNIIVSPEFVSKLYTHFSGVYLNNIKTFEL